LIGDRPTLDGGCWELAPVVQIAILRFKYDGYGFLFGEGRKGDMLNFWANHLLQTDR